MFNHKQKEKTMANTKEITFFENKLLDFVTAKDPVLEMMQWVMDKFMEIEVAHKTGAEKGASRLWRMLFTKKSVTITGLRARLSWS